MRIGELATQTGTTTRALRLYEAMGLLEARRLANRYREYDREDVRIVREIRNLQSVGFSLDEMRPFVDCLRAGNETGDSCPDSIAVYRRKLAQVDACIGWLSTLRQEIDGKLKEACARRYDALVTGSDDPVCGAY